MAAALHEAMRMAKRAPMSLRARRGLVIGPSDAGADVSVAVARARPAPAREGTGTRRPVAGYAHVNRWSLNDRGAASDDTAARLIADDLERRPGFVSYALVRTGAREVVAVTIFETEAQLRAAMDAIAPSVRRHVRPLAAAGPERRQGEVLHYRAGITARERPAAASARTR